jgi:SAM-dependent methyltransferase
MAGAEGRRLRDAFNEDAERYQRARPSYPGEIFVDLKLYADIGPGSRVLEIGCGTGQATVPLAHLGHSAGTACDDARRGRIGGSSAHDALPDIRHDPSHKCHERQKDDQVEH